MIRLCTVGGPYERIRNRKLGKRRRDHGDVAESPRRLDRALGCLVHLPETRAPKRVGGELDHDRHGLAGALIRELLERVHEALTGLFLQPEIRLHSCARAGERGSQHVGAVGHEIEGLEQRTAAVVEAPHRRQRTRAGEEKLDPLLCRRVGGFQAKSLSEPVRRIRRRQPRRFLAGLAKDGDGVGVALARRALDVVGARGGGSAPRRERVGAPLVRAEPPAGSRRLVDGATYERMAEAEPSRDVGRAEEIDPEQLVERLHDGRLGQRGRRRRELRLERVTGHRRPFEHETLRVGQQGELFRKSRGDARRNHDPGQRHLVVHCRCPTCAGKLLEIEGVATALGIEDVRIDALARVAE